MEYSERLPGNKKIRKSQPALSSPEIKVTYAPLGRETLEAIASELVPDPRGGEPRPKLESCPEIVVGTTALGRETLAAIEEELRPAPAPAAPRPRPRRGKSSRPPAGVKTKERRVFADANPEIIVGDDVLPPAEATAKLEIFEMLTFIVKNVEAEEFSTEGLRRSFVEQHLSRHLRGHSVETIARVDVTPWTERGSVVARIWCRVS